jgi:class 3 adenylate cyclase
MQREIEVAILFADICGSTHVYRALGDVLAHDILADRIATLIAVTKECHGTLVKTLGDEVMTTFATADEAAEAAVRMQERTTGTLAAEGPQLKIRVGFHYGPVLTKDADIYGEAVNIAARMASLAKAGQILTTAASTALLSPSWRAATQRLDEGKRGSNKRERVDAYEIVWQQPATDFADQPFPSLNIERVGGGQLLLTAADGHVVELGADRPTLTVGRGDGNDLIVKHSLVSRLHARVEYQEGEFVLIDQSSNGTYVVSASGRSTYFRRNKYVLEGAGAIGLGKAPARDSPVTLRYETRAAVTSPDSTEIRQHH